MGFRRPKQVEPPLTEDQVDLFRRAVLEIIEADTAHEAAEDYDANTAMLNQLYDALTPEQFERFYGILEQANDSDARCPK